MLDSLLQEIIQNSSKMTMWADNIKFVKDILDQKYAKIDSAAAEMNENAEALLKDATCTKSREHFTASFRVLEIMQISDIETLLETIISDLHGKEKEMLEIMQISDIETLLE